MTRLLAEYSGAEEVVAALEVLARAGAEVVQVYGPVPWNPPRQPPSPVRRWVLGGGILGCLAGLALTVGTALDLPLIVGGKPVVSLPPFLIIAFELTILLGALGGVAGFLLHAALPRPAPPEGYRAEFAVDRFGVVVEAEAAAPLEELLARTGARRVLAVGEEAR